jgi:hypothetical protein
MNAPETPIESYLDELLVACADLPPREARRLLAEVEAHLYDQVEALLASGAREHEAQQQAVAQFGPVHTIVRAERDRGRLPLGTLARQVLGSAVLLGSVGAIAVGISGVLAAIFRSIGGARFVVGDPSRGGFSGVDCARWLHADPHAASCAAAAVSDLSAEAIWYRIALGALGALGALVLLAARRFLGRGSGRSLPRQVNDTIAITLFLAAAVAMTALGVDAIVTSSGRGSGQWFSAAPVALAAAAFYGARLTPTLRRPAVRTA